MTFKENMRIAVIVGSVREGRLAPTVADWFVRHSSIRSGIEIDLVDLAELRLPDVITKTIPPEIEALSARLRAADAVVIVTPEYNHSFPAALKNAIDWFYEEWQRKPVGFVSYGGSSGGLHAVGQLRQVFAGLRAIAVNPVVSFPASIHAFGPDGEPVSKERANRAADALLDELSWWSETLRARVATAS